ncbi:hypothetical protein FZC76_06070 [Sutcliffiella horikoshii]|uniref:Uncharacterized protein n=1 Tax=Sutcliffiella horikoshii TaxID=79883 RepID=A0A5D4T2K1_9BACI|nr:hypothetical protein [Sutcliffiella horikoshii]TYS69793.1 hypothetical protein FZC76_06070 [Sutcliffiella horikoshii]
MWLILLGIIYLFLVIKGHLWAIIVVILCTAVILPGFNRRAKIFVKEENHLPKKTEVYKQGDIFGLYTDPLALHQQKKEREKLEMEGRKKI